MSTDRLTHLKRLEAEFHSHHAGGRGGVPQSCDAVFHREGFVGDASSGDEGVSPARPPFPLMHIDTTWKFREMIRFRDETARRLGLDLIVHTNQDGVAKNINPFDHGSSFYTNVMKTEALKTALTK